MSFKTFKSAANAITKNLGRSELNTEIHAYAVDVEMLKADFGISDSTADKILKEVIAAGRLWKTEGLGNYDERYLPKGVAIAYLKYTKSSKISKGREVRIPRGESGKYLKSDKFNATKFNDLNTIIKLLILNDKKGSTSNIRDIEKGHLFSSAVSESTYLKGKKGIFKSFPLIQKAYEISKHRFYRDLRSGLEAELSRKAQKDIKVRIDHKFIKNYKGVNGELQGNYIVFVHPQTKETNAVWSQLESEFNNRMKIIVDNFGRLDSMTSSKSIIQHMSRLFTEAFFGKKPKAFKEESSQSTTVTTKTRATLRKPVNTFAPTEDLLPDESQIPVNLAAIINSRLHDSIQNIMGDGSATDVLNYQTGRFANSAMVTGFTQTRENHIVIFYNYMKNPYATFDRGGQQYKPSRRGPKLIINQSIRETAAQLLYDRFAITPKSI